MTIKPPARLIPIVEALPVKGTTGGVLGGVYDADEDGPDADGHGPVPVPQAGGVGPMGPGLDATPGGMLATEDMVAVLDGQDVEVDVVVVMESTSFDGIGMDDVIDPPDVQDKQLVLMLPTPLPLLPGSGVDPVGPLWQAVHTVKVAVSA